MSVLIPRPKLWRKVVLEIVQPGIGNSFMLPAGDVYDLLHSHPACLQGSIEAVATGSVDEVTMDVPDEANPDRIIRALSIRAVAPR